MSFPIFICASLNDIHDSYFIIIILLDYLTRIFFSHFFEEAAFNVFVRANGNIRVSLKVGRKKDLSRFRSSLNRNACLRVMPTMEKCCGIYFYVVIKFGLISLFALVCLTSTQAYTCLFHG